MQLNNWFEKGISKEAYEETLEKHHDAYFHIYKTFQLPNDEEFFRTLKAKNIRTLILAEPWCGHCMLNIPIMLRILEQAEVETRFLLRDENLEIMDAYLTNGNRTIPIVIFIDEDGNDIGTWGPIAPVTKAFVDPHRKELPPKDAPEYETAFRTFADKVSKGFKEDETLWQGIYEDMKNTLEGLKA